MSEIEIIEATSNFSLVEELFGGSHKLTFEKDGDLLLIKARTGDPYESFKMSLAFHVFEVLLKRLKEKEKMSIKVRDDKCPICGGIMIEVEEIPTASPEIFKELKIGGLDLDKVRIRFCMIFCPNPDCLFCKDDGGIFFIEDQDCHFFNRPDQITEDK